MQEPNSLTISLAPSLGDYFREPVTQAIRGREVQASSATESYIVQLLSDFAKPTPETTSALTESVTLLLRDAIAESGPERFRRLQRLGDGVLYGMGFFNQKTHGVDRKYLARVGATAYDHAARMLRTGQGKSAGPDILNELATKFEGFVEVLRYVSDWVEAKSARDEEGLVRLYERWLKTKSPLLKDELGQRGMFGLGNDSGFGGGIH
jgi:hypothetical protein